MKDLIRKRWFVFLFGIVVAVVGLLLFGLILYCIGYRIVYPRQFETSWDAVSGFAAWFGVGVSILSASASFFAIWFAVRVADKQNKIALFEKRYNCYLIIYNLLLCSDSLKKSNAKIATPAPSTRDLNTILPEFQPHFHALKPQSLIIALAQLSCD